MYFAKQTFKLKWSAASLEGGYEGWVFVFQEYVWIVFCFLSMEFLCCVQMTLVSFAEVHGGAGEIAEVVEVPPRECCAQRRLHQAASFQIHRTIQLSNRAAGQHQCPVVNQNIEEETQSLQVNIP